MMRQEFYVAGMVLAMAIVAGCGNLDMAQDKRQRGTALVASATGPQFVQAAHGNYAVKLEWLSGEPKVKEDGSARLTFLGADGNAARQARIDEVALWMPQHGHGSVVEPQVNQVAAQPADVVEVTSIQVQMSGDWELRISATVDKLSDTAALAFTVP